MKYQKSVIGLMLCFTLTGVAAGDDVKRIGYPRPARKIIVYGWELGFREVADLRRQAHVMQRQPFNGIMFSLFHKGKSRDEAFIHSAMLTDDQMAPIVKELSAIRWTTFTDNFMMLKVGEKFLDNGEPARVDWFDDAQWKTICHNIRVLTRVAKAAHCVGLGFDPEPYHTAVWNYDKVGSRPAQLHRKTQSFEEYAAIVRKRGAEYMNVIQAEMPKIRIFNLYQAVRLPPSEIAETIYSLYPAFINGILDVAGPDVTMIDGNEYGFGLLTRADYTHAYVNVKERKLALIDPKNRKKYRQQVQVSVPIYLDDIFGSHANRRWVGTYLTPDDKQQLFEHKLFHALDSVDEYVWVYGERPAWFGNPARVPRWAVKSVKDVKSKMSQLRLQERPEDTALMKRVRERMKFRDQELARLTAAERTTPRLNRPQATIYKIANSDAPPKIDGMLDDPVWKNATVLKDFRPLLYFVRDRSEVDTVCRVTWDNENLYLALECREPRIKEFQSISAEERKRNRITIISRQPTNRPRPFFVRVDVPFGGSVSRMVKLKREWRQLQPKDIEDCIVRVHKMSDIGWTAELQLDWGDIFNGAPQSGESRPATVTRVRAPWNEHVSWAPQIDPNLIDDELLGTWLFQER